MIVQNSQFDSIEKFQNSELSSHTKLQINLMQIQINEQSFQTLDNNLEKCINLSDLNLNL
ncbi:hypothetical protein ABPG73_011938, partial [Tetrahymena malaccensis]